MLPGRRYLLLAAVCLAAVPLAFCTCSKELSEKKNLADSQAASAWASSTKDMSVSDLASMPARPEKLILQYKDKRFPEEKFRVHVDALLIGYKLEADEDYHLVIADPDDRRATMIVEIPSENCITIDLREQMADLRAKFDQQIGKPTSKYKKLPHPIAVSVEGVLFRDYSHGQTGAAKSGAEVHPVLVFDRKPAQLPAHTSMAKLDCDGICSNPCQNRCFTRNFCPSAD